MDKIWIIAPFSEIEKSGTRNRFQYLANRLHDEGMDVTLFTSNFSHREKIHVSSKISNEYPFKVKLINEPGYNKNVSVRRALSHIKFAINLNKEIKKTEKPDVIYAAYPTMSASYVAGNYAKDNSIPFIIDVQDTWPESVSSAIDTENIMTKLLMWPFTKFANGIYKMADVVFGVSETYVQRANIKGTKCKEFIPVYIGAQLGKFNDYCCITSEMKEKNDDIWITYIGTLSHSYDIQTAVKAFAQLRQYDNIKLNILGTGPDEESLIRLSKELGTYGVNVFFYGFIEYEKMMAILNESDIALNAIKGTAKQTITNKLGDYLSAALPILNSCQEKEVIDLVNNKDLGINYVSGDVTSLINAIIYMISNKNLMKKYSKNARFLAEKYFDREESYKVIINMIKNMC